MSSLKTFEASGLHPGAGAVRANLKGDQGLFPGDFLGRTFFAGLRALVFGKLVFMLGLALKSIPRKWDALGRGSCAKALVLLW